MSQKTFLTEEPATRAAWTLTGFQVNLYAEDVEAAIAFYAALGFEESYRYPASRRSSPSEGSAKAPHAAQRAQPRGDLLARHAGTEPPLVDLEASAEIDERVAGDHRAPSRAF
jgi:catechol 2,3-dioxygenase-like lactoylglutathione lyase family enzyme